ncbi:MAG: hypothetical protein AAGF12_24155 [Myxococcota bacterium]
MTAEIKRHPVMGGLDLLVGALILFGVWVLLPARWWPVDVVGTGLALALLASGFGLVRGEAWAPRVAFYTVAATTAFGAVAVTLLVYTASYLVGLYGPVGEGGALILIVVALLVLPYLVFIPASQLFFLARRER